MYVPLRIFLTSASKCWEVSNAGYSHLLCTNPVTVWKCLFIEYDDLQEVYQISKKRPLFEWSSVIMLNVFENCSGAHHCCAHF
jgi:hypothetical protein